MKQLSFLIQYDDELLQKHHNDLQLLVDGMISEYATPFLPMKKQRKILFTGKQCSSSKFCKFPFPKKIINPLSKFFVRKKEILKDSKIKVEVIDQNDCIETEIITIKL